MPGYRDAFILVSALEGIQSNVEMTHIIRYL